MIKQNSLLKNTTFLISGQMLRRFISFFTSLMVARTLGPEKFGQYNYVITLITILAILWEFGLNSLITRDVSRDLSTAAYYSGAHVILKLLLMVVGSTIIGIYLLVVQEEKVVALSIVLFALTSFLTNINGIWYGVFRAFRRMDYVAFLPALFSLQILIFLLVIFRYNQEIHSVFSCYLASRLIIFFISSSLLIKALKVVPKFEVNLKDIRRLAATALPFFMTTAVNIILFRIDHIMLSKMIGDFELGLYSSNYTIFEVLISLFPMTIMGAAFPILSSLYVNDFAQMEQLFRLVLKYFILISVPMGCGLIMLGPETIVSIYGKEYLEGGVILSLLGYSIPIFFLTQLISWTLTAADRQKKVFYSNLIAMILNVLLNLYMIRHYSSIGAAISTMVCEAMQLLFMGYFLRNLVKINVELYWGVTALATIVMGGFIFWVKQLPYDIYRPEFLAATILLSVIIYFSIVLPLKVFKFDEVKKLLSA